MGNFPPAKCIAGGATIFPPAMPNSPDEGNLEPASGRGGGNIAAWVAAYKRDLPLHNQFPIVLKNGKSVPGMHVICNNCGNHISGDRLRGRVIPSLPHVVTIDANGVCEPCDRLTHIDCRFRASGDEALIEWLGSTGLWQAREYRQPTLTEKITKRVRRLLGK